MKKVFKLREVSMRISEHKRSSSNFSLIELLVVVAIIGVLASLLLPTLGKARETAKAMTCLNKMKQIHTAQFMHIDDNDGELPYLRDGTKMWFKAIATYLGVQISGYYPAMDANADGNIYKCPSRVNTYSNIWGYGSYNFPKWCGLQDRNPPAEIGNISDPKNALLHFDGGSSLFDAGSLNNLPGSARVAHNDTTNIIFLDGHARTKIYNKRQFNEDASSANYFIDWSRESGR